VADSTAVIRQAPDPLGDTHGDIARAPRLTERFQDALGYAARIHASDIRKGTTILYIGDLLSVCSLILVDGGSENEAIAGLLHDTLEDHGDVVRPEELECRFGRYVLTLVEGCTDCGKHALLADCCRSSRGAYPSFSERPSLPRDGR
jgi:(p)ppGpp synthase/HD superfamily hydrolase